MAIDIPNYQILSKLGRGAGSTLLLARSARTGARYTVKVVKVQQPEDMKFVDQLRSEHAAGSSIDHPVVRKTYELRFVRRRLTKIKSAMLFMEYVDGLALNNPDFSCPLLDLLTHFRMTAEGLQGMHRAGYVHADLKPGNILITPDGRVKLIDLGQACQMGTVKSKVQGTPDYIAPEQVSLGALDARTDVFGLGATLYKVLTGKAMPTDMNQRVCLQRMSLVGRRTDELNQPLDGALAAPIERLIEECCQKDPAKRLPNMKAIIDRLEMTRDVLVKRGVATGRPTGSKTGSSPSP